MKSLFLFLLCSVPCFGQEMLPRPTAQTHRFVFDKSPLAIAHWTAAAFDYSTTGNSISQCNSWYGVHPDTATLCRERNPLGRPFVGNGSRARLALGFAAESVGVSLIPNRKVRRIVQISLIGAHVWFGARNLKEWH